MIIKKKKVNTSDVDGIDWSGTERQRYDRIHHRIKRIARIVNLLQGVQTVLDIGCCGAKIGKLIKPDISYYGCDIVPVGKGLLKDNRFALWDVEMKDVSTLPFDVKKFDCLIISGVFEHIKQYDITFENISKLVKSGGYVVLSYANPDFILYKTGITIRRNDANWISRLLTKKQILSRLKRKNINLIKTNHLSYFIYYPSIPIVSFLCHVFTNQYIYIFQKQ